MKKYLFPILLILTGCSEPNLASVNFCTDATAGPVAGVTLKNKQGGEDNLLCHFPEGATCKGLRESKHVDVVKENLIQKDCVYK